MLTKKGGSMYYNFDGTPLIQTCIQPYDDDFMTFDSETRRYVLTEKYAFEKLGLDLYEDVNDRNSINAQIAVSRILKQCSNMIYNFVYDFSIYNNRQDYLIATVPKMRKIIMEAMGEQLLYMAQVGDLSRSTDPAKRKLAIDENAKTILINSGICYCGV